jgi:hypothetical protein
MDAEVRISIWMFVSSSHSLGWKINPDVVLSLCRWALGTCKVERAPSAESRGRNCGMLDRNAWERACWFWMLILPLGLDKRLTLRKSEELF